MPSHRARPFGTQSARSGRHRFRKLHMEALEPRLVLDGASLVQDLLPGPDSSHPFIVGNLGDTVFFSAGNADGTRSLWTVSGSQDPVSFASLDTAGGGFEFDGTLYFGASDGVHGFELWRTDGTAAGTAMVKDIREGPFGSFNGLGFAPLNGELYFSAFHPDYGSELWKTDGTEAGTVLVKDILPGTAGSDPREIVAAGGLLFFQANDGVSGREVWRSDGTEQGTLLTKDVFPGSANTFRPEELTALGDVVYFRHGNLSTGEELWRSDGTEAGTVIVRDIYPGQTCRPTFCFANHSRPDEITAMGSLLYFSADSATGRELYKSDGTELGTVLVRDIYPDSDGIEPYRSNPTDFTELGGFVYFFIEHFDDFGQSELWKTDGTEAGTVRVKDLNPLESANAFRLTAIGQSLYFVACGDVSTGDDGGDPTNCEPWVSDGTEAGTVVLQDINPGLASSFPQGDFVGGGGSVFFNADDGEHGAELWRTGIAVRSGADLAASISDSPDPVVVGQPVTYTVTVTNFGPEDATGVVVSASAPASTDFNSVMVPIGDLPSGQSRSFEITFAPQNVGTFELTASVIGGEEDPNAANNTAAETTAVEPSSTIELAAATYEVSEGDELAFLTVRRMGDLNHSASVEFTTVGGTAGQRGILAGLTRVDDFTTTSGTLFFRPRQNVTTIRVPIRDDNLVEGDETFQVVLSNPSADARLGDVASATVTIVDNDPSLSFATGSSEIVEGSGRIKKLAIPVTLSNSLPRKVTVAYTVTGGTATFGQDFRPQSGTLTFRPRTTKQSIPLQIIGDAVHELDETVVIELTSSTNAFLGGTTRHRVTIKNDDPLPPPADPGSTPATALAIDLQTLPRQTFSHSMSRNDAETFRVELAAGERLVLDVDPSGTGTALPSSTMTILAGDGITVLNTISASAEPEGGRVTNNPATLFQADADGGTYFIRLTTTTSGKGYGYALHFHRIGVAEEVPHPDLLNVGGSMFAWYDGVDTVGITGPTGYGFTLTGPWQQVVSQVPRGALRSQTLTLLSGSQFTMRSPQGVELPLLANGPIVITTQMQRWGDIVGRVATPAIDFPVSLAIEPINDLLADAIGSEFAAVGLLSGQWRISLGAAVLHADGRNANRPVDETLAGIPYLRQKGPINFNANLGGFSLDYRVIETLVEWIFDPADPMLYVKADKVGEVKEAALAVSLNGLIEFKPQDAPDPLIDAGVTEFFGHVYGTAKVPFKIGPLPMEVEAEIVANVDADRDGKLLGDLRDVDELFDVLQGDFSEVREIVNDVQLGANGTLIMALQQKKDDPLPAGTYTMEAGRASVVLDGLAETIWVRGQQGGDVLTPPFLKRLNSSASIVTEGLITWDGAFFLSTTTSYSVGGIDFEYEIGFTHEGIFARIRGSVDWSVKFEYQGVRVSGTAIAEIEADVAIEFDDDGDVHLAGSISASGKLRYNGNNVFSGSIDASVRSKGFRFRFPRGVGSLDLDILI